MASKQVVQIMIEAEENVSKAAGKAESSLSKLGKLGSKAMDAITNVSSRVSNAFSSLVHMLKEQGKNSTVSRTVVTNWE